MEEVLGVNGGRLGSQEGFWGSCGGRCGALCVPMCLYGGR